MDWIAHREFVVGALPEAGGGERKLATKRCIGGDLGKAASSPCTSAEVQKII